MIENHLDINSIRKRLYKELGCISINDDLYNRPGHGAIKLPYQIIAAFEDEQGSYNMEYSNTVVPRKFVIIQYDIN